VKNKVKSLWTYSLGKIKHAYPNLSIVNQALGELPDGFPTEVDCLVATKNGLYLLKKKRIYKLLFGNYYGICRWQNFWCVFEKLCEKHGRIIKIDIDGTSVKKVDAVIDNLSPGCHQIDEKDNLLYVTDTYNNRLIIYSCGLNDFNKLHEIYPRGKLKHGRDSKNYVHMNSVWINGKGLPVLFYHNQTSKTKRNGEIAHLNSDFVECDSIEVEAANGHNIIPVNNKWAYCDSMNAKLVCGEIGTYEATKFTRGLAKAHHYWLVGESDYGCRKIRSKLKGAVLCLDRDLKSVCKVELGGMVQEIRLLGLDYGQSRYSNYIK